MENPKRWIPASLRIPAGMLVLSAFTWSGACTVAPTPPPAQVETATTLNAEPVTTQESPGRAPESYQRYTIVQLDAVASYLTALITAGVDSQLARKHPPRILPCDPPQAQASTWMMGLKSLIDEKLGPEGEAYLARPVDERTEDMEWKRCEAICACGTYAMILAAIDDAKLTPKDRDFLASLNQKRDAETDQTALKCAHNQKWFCESSLRSYLKTNSLH